MHKQNNHPKKIITLQEFLTGLGRDDVATTNLVSYFDVLIQMDLELKDQERIDDHEKDNQSSNI